MVSFVPFINVFLAVLGISLVALVISEKARILYLKLLFAGYFVVVLQYNFERIITPRTYLILAAAALSLLAWYIPGLFTEERLSSD